MATILSVAGLTASAQNVAASGAFVANPLNDINFVPTPQYCVAPGTTASTPITFTFTLPAGIAAADVSWRVAGDFSLVTGFPQGVTGTSFQVRPVGKGKLRVTVNYYTVACQSVTFNCGSGTTTATIPVRSTATRSFDFYKSFTTPASDITGPTCLLASSSVVYSVPPVLTGASQVGAGIGVDTYEWEVKYTSAGTPNVPFSFLAGDGSAISIPASSVSTTAGNFTVKVKVGRCNTPITLPGGVTVVQDLNSATAITGFPACRLVTTPASTTASFTINTLSNVNYTVTVPAP